MKTKKYLITLLTTTFAFTFATNSSNSWIQKAVKYVEQQDFDQAINFYAKELRQNPKCVEAIYGIARCHFIKEEYERAHIYFAYLHSLSPKTMQFLVNMNKSLDKIGRFKFCIENLEKMVCLRPSDEKLTGSLQWRYIQHEAFDTLAQRWPDLIASSCWNNLNVANKKVIMRLHKNVGFGDIFMFVRGAKLLKNAGAYVILETSRNVIPLLSLCPYIDKLVLPGSTLEYDEYYSVECPTIATLCSKYAQVKLRPA